MPVAPLHNETLLVAQLQTGNKAAFTTLYRHYSPPLYINILRMVKDRAAAEEMVQELFTRVWQKRESKGIRENFAGYLYTIGQNLVQDHYRKLKRDRRALQQLVALREPSYANVEDAMAQRQVSALISQAIEQLAPQQKRVYQLVKIEGVTYKTAARIMGISPLTIKEYLVASNKSIRNYILHHAGSGQVLLALLALAAGA